MAKFLNIMMAAAIASGGLAVTAAAEEGEKVRAVVRYGDLNLASADDRDRLQTRVRSAVRYVCGTRMAYSQGLPAQLRAKRCEKIAMQDADVKLASLFEGNGTAVADRGQVIVAAP